MMRSGETSHHALFFVSTHFLDAKRCRKLLIAGRFATAFSRNSQTDLRQRPPRADDPQTGAP
jgi:hypothetical protein